MSADVLSPVGSFALSASFAGEASGAGAGFCYAVSGFAVSVFGGWSFAGSGFTGSGVFGSAFAGVVAGRSALGLSCGFSGGSVVSFETAVSAGLEAAGLGAVALSSVFA
ncbi:hypothetical protein [Breoghania sp.]|uniref:hypothetical protein n=1 Tax=Breoghania sp. TaxID=2065378 RepID=UPI002616AEB6|nr:hypothetical protein [Breoghania sp.]MDJ0932686.1 hypothetical protein [Breoghania sp.]